MKFVTDTFIILVGLLLLKDSNNIEASDLEIFELNPPQLNDGPIRAKENVQKQV